jgi:hypothetical protein
MSSRKFGIAEVRNLVKESMALTPEAVQADFVGQGGHDIRMSEMSTGSKRLMKFFEPITDQVDFEGAEGHDSRYSKKYADNKKLLACHGMLNALRGGAKRLNQEATTAGVDLPTFTRQLLMTITRAYARLFTPELFGVLPLNQPTGRINFKDYLYDSSFYGSTPNVNVGDRQDDITKFNPDFYKAPEGQNANRVTFKYSNLDVSVSDYRVIAEWSDTLADDAMSVYDDDAENSLMNQMAQEMARVVDRSMVLALINGYNTNNQYDFTAQPTSNPNYGTLSPSEQQSYDERLYRVGINTVINKIRVTRRYRNDGDPNWAIVGTDFALAMSKLTMFVPYETSMTEIATQTGALRDLGVLKGGNVRYLVDPMLAVTVQNATGDTTGASHSYFGRTPREKGDVGLYYMPYIALQPTRDLYDPQTGMTMKGARSRFGIAQPNTGTNAASSQLGDIYGRLRIQ